MVTPADFNSLAWQPWQQLFKMRGNIEAAALNQMVVTEIDTSNRDSDKGLEMAKYFL